MLVAASGRKFRPIIVYLLLRIATDDKGNRFRELEERAAVERRKRLAVKFKSDGENFRRAGSAAGIVQHFKTAGVLEYREIEIYRIFCVVVEPEKRCNARKFRESTHCGSLFYKPARPYVYAVHNKLSEELYTVHKTP